MKLRNGKTVLDGFRQSGSMKCLFPRLPRSAFETVLVNTAGGVTGGDDFSFAGYAGQGTQLTVTTQACERAYRAQPGQTGTVRNSLRVASKARINWLPQETILFDQSSLNRKLAVEMAPDATLLLVEPLVLGRAAMGETVNDATLKDRIDIRRDGTPLYLDALRLEGDVTAHLANPFIANGAGAMASVVYVANNAEAHLNTLRDLLPDTAGASLLQPDVLFMRVLAEDSFVLRKSLIPALTFLNKAPLPRCWMI